jgi:chorismate synthase
MSGNTFGTLFRVTTWGESHGTAVGAVIDGCPAGMRLDPVDVQHELDRRRPGQSQFSTSRSEDDRVEVLSGIFEGRTTGTPISMIVRNKDAKSSAYEPIRNRPRPGHADFTYMAKYGIRDHRGGGRASARETVGRVAAGAVAIKLLRSHGIEIAGYVTELGGVAANIPDWTERGEIGLSDLQSIREDAESSAIRCPDRASETLMMKRLMEAKGAMDSIGGIVEIVALGLPPGLGEPVFGKLDADLAGALMSIGAVKAVEIGSGVKSARMLGSEMNDPVVLRDRCDQGIGFERNRAGGILGGISTGAPLICRISVKPTPSIGLAQKTVDMISREAVSIEVKGRHDPSIPPRIVPVAEAMIAIVLADHLLRLRAASVCRHVADGSGALADGISQEPRV